MDKGDITVHFIIKFMWWNFLIWIVFGVLPLSSFLPYEAWYWVYKVNPHMIAVIVLTFIYLPIKIYFIGYKTLQAKCPGCKTIYTFSKCPNCGNSKFLHDRCMACGEYDHDIADTTCEECGTRGLKYRAK